MAWSGNLTSDSAIGTAIKWTPDNPESQNINDQSFYAVHDYAGNYSVTSFTAPKRGIYRFDLKGSGGARDPGGGKKIDGTSCATGGAVGGVGGTTVGYLLLEAGQTVYVGAGGVCRAAFVSSAYGSSLAAISANNLYFVAGAGGSGGAWGDSVNFTGYNCEAKPGGNGGGTTGAKAEGNDSYWQGGGGGTQSAGGSGGKAHSSRAESRAGSYGTGGMGYGNLGSRGGRGGDGYYGGGSGGYNGGGGNASGGGGGSGYVKTATLTVMSNTYTSTTSQGGGAACNNAGSVTVTYYAKADIQVIFNGTRLERIIFNGVEIESLIYNGTKLFARRCREWLWRFAGREFTWRAVKPVL